MGVVLEEDRWVWSEKRTGVVIEENVGVVVEEESRCGHRRVFCILYSLVNH